MDAIRRFIDRCMAESADFGPIPAWWWSGEMLEIGRMRWQMDQMRAMGIRQFVVINLAPSGTMFCSDADDPPYMSEAWWTIFRQVCDYAEQTGMKVWFYDQIGFSGASYQADIATAHPQFIAQQLRRVSATGTGRLSVSCPESGVPIRAYAVADTGEVSAVSVEARGATYDASRLASLHLVYTVRQGYDLLSREACDTLLDTVHRQFERRLPDHLGKTIVGSYQDELPDLPTWADTFAVTFQARFGYCLLERIHHLFEEGSDDARRTRVHYHQHRAQLAEEAFFMPFFQWHETHGLRCGFDQQSPAREARILGATEKYADYMRTHRWYACPGSDLHGNGTLHASIASLNQRPRVWLEGFHSTGWGGTLADTFDWMLPYLRQGVTLYNPHAIYYSTQKGWWEWAPPSTCWRQPFAMHYRPFAQMIERLLSVLSRGEMRADVGILFPTTTVQSAVGIGAAFDEAKRADIALHETIGSVRWHQAKPGAIDEFRTIILDEDSIADAESDTDLRIAGTQLKAVVLPAVTMMCRRALERLKRFAANGGLVIAIGSQTCHTVEGDAIEFDSFAAVIDSPAQLRKALETMSCTIESELPALHRETDGVHLLFVPAVDGMATVVEWESWFAPLERATVDTSRYAKSTTLRLPAGAKRVMRFDPRDGSLEELSHEIGEPFTLEFSGSPFAVLLWDESEGSASVRSDLATSQEIVLDSNWDCRYEATLPREHADIYDPDRDYLRWPHTSVFRWTDLDTDESAQVRATFGPRATVVSGADRSLDYSPQFGIDHDSLHQHTLGPKARVPEEFWDLGKMEAGQSSTVRFGVQCDHEANVELVVSANALKSASVNGISLPSMPKAYRNIIPCRLTAGTNSIELTFVADRNGAVRAGYCFVEKGSPHLMAVPDRIVSPSKAVLGSIVRFEKRFDVPGRIDRFELKISTAAVAKVLLDGQPIGRQGGFDPYRLQPRGMVYRLSLEPGRHTLALEVLDTGSSVLVLVDGFGETETGEGLSIQSDATWTVVHGSHPPQPAAIQLKQDIDGSAWLLKRRPHPLPQTGWLERREHQSVVLDLPPEPILAQAHRQQFEWIISPGARSMSIGLAAGCSVDSLEIDGEAFPYQAGWIDISGNRSARAATLVLRSRHTKGATMERATIYAFDEGKISTSTDFALQGLSEYSGAIRLRQRVSMPDIAPSRVVLDLGEVRGTVEAIINGRSAGVRFIPPFTFDITQMMSGRNLHIELVLTNTLASHLAHWSPTRCIAGDQLRFGVGMNGGTRIGFYS